jgi:hypothetical protein
MLNPSLFAEDSEQATFRVFTATTRNLYKRLFRLYSHVYWTHTKSLRDDGTL